MPRHGRAAAKANLVIKDMTRWEIMPSPQNYHVWYEYLSGHNAELTRAVEAIIASNEGFSDHVVSELFQQHVSEQKIGKDLKRAQLATQTILKDVLDELIAVGGITSGYQKKLEQYSETLGADPTDSEFQQLVNDLLTETTEMQQAGVQLLKNLEETKSRAESLQRQLHRMEEEGLMDNLTGLGNRRAALERMQELRQVSVESNQSFSIFEMEIDRFEIVHQNHGRDIGDAVLRRVATVLKDNLKGRDFSARFGDERFVVILPATPLDAAVTVANILREAIQGMRLQVAESDADLGSITASFGVAEFDFEDGIEGLVDRAGRALSVATRLGGDSVGTDHDL